jgi:ketosteroid isomerase-like protein
LEDVIQVSEAAHNLANAIACCDEKAMTVLLDKDFTLRTPGGESLDAEAFISGIRNICDSIIFVKLEDLHVDLTEASALVTGVQHARVRVKGKEVDDRRPFVDLFVRGSDGAWRVKLALDLPAYM